MKKAIIKTLLFLSFLISSTVVSFAQSGNTEIFTVVEESPSFIGGQTAMVQFLSKNLQYPTEALEKNVEGVVYVSFIVEKDGLISNVILKRDIGSGCGEEALRVVKMMPNWLPGKQKGKAVRTQFILPISFKLN